MFPVKYEHRVLFYLRNNNENFIFLFDNKRNEKIIGTENEERERNNSISKEVINVIFDLFTNWI